MRALSNLMMAVVRGDVADGFKCNPLETIAFGNSTAAAKGSSVKFGVNCSQPLLETLGVPVANVSVRGRLHK